MHGTSPSRPGSSQGMALVLFLLLCFGTSGLGAIWTNMSVGDWYATLVKPSWNPPNWLFGPVWTALYLGMAISAWLVWRKRGLWDARGPLLLFTAQLVLNAAWSGLFFGLRSPGSALIDIGVLWLAILATMVAFWQVSSLAGILLLPYLAWVSFASILNWVLWRLNP